VSSEYQVTVAPEPTTPPPSSPPQQPKPQSKGYEYLIASVRAGMHRQLWVQGALCGAGVSLLSVAAAGAVISRAPDLGRALLILSPILGGAIACYFGLYLGHRRVGDAFRTARMLSERLPEVSLDLLAAVEVKRALESENGFSVELAHAFLQQMDERASRQDAARALDRRHTRIAAGIFAVAGLAAALIIFSASDAWFAGMSTAFDRRLKANQSRREPITGDVELTYRYPAYTGLAPKTVPGTAGDVSALAGTEVQIKTRADREVAKADLVVNGTGLPLQVIGDRDLSGSFVIDKPGSYHFVFFKPADRKIAEGPAIPIAVEPDDPPKVSLLSPSDDLEIDPGQRIVLKYTASDDFGLTSLELVYRTPRDREDRRVALELGDERHSKGEYRWDLSALKLAPGERVSYYLAARDNDEVSGKKLGVSRTQSIKIYSASEHRRDAVRKAEALWERLVAHLASRLEGPDRDPEKESDKIPLQSSLDQSGGELASEMLQTARELSRQRDTPEELWTAMTNIARGFQKRLRNTATYRRIFLRSQLIHLADGDPAKRLSKALEEEIAETEKDVLYLESLLDRQKLQDLKEVAKQLANDRRELASLVEQFKQTHDPKLQESILRQVQALRARINEAVQRMAQLAKVIRDEHLNAEALSHMMPERDTQSELDDIERLMREGKADEALAKLQEMAQQMEEMLKGLERSDDQFGEQQYPELAAKFRQFMDELRQTTQEQKRLSDQTKEVRDRYKSETKQRLAQKGRALRDQLMKEAEELAKDYREVGPEQITRAEKQLEETQSQLENLRNALKVEDYDLAAEAAARAERSAAEVSAHAEMKKQLDQRYGNMSEAAQSKQLAERMNKDARRVQEINQKLQQLFPPPGSMLSEADRDKLGQQAGDERQLQKRAQGLQQRMDELSQMAPVFGEDSSDQMNQVARRMGEASQRLESKDPNRGYNEQKAALEELQKFQQQMREAQSKGRGSRSLPMPMVAGNRSGDLGPNSSQEPVAIPGPDQAPKEFRKDLMDAMKQGAPEKYKDQVKRYYEELVK
jgi:hypothetical protein